LSMDRFRRELETPDFFPNMLRSIKK